jgi:hypothetical protein
MAPRPTHPMVLARESGVGGMLRAGTCLEACVLVKLV